MTFNLYKPKIKNSYKKIADVLEAKQLTNIMVKARLLLQLETILQNVLPDILKIHCHVMNIDNNTLIVKTDNAAYAMQARFSENDLLYAIEKHARISEINHINFCVRPSIP